MKEKRFNLTIRVITGLLAGIFCGLFFGESCVVLKPIGEAFIKIMQITVLPTIVVALISGLGGLKQTDARNLLLKGGSVLFMLWCLGIAAFFSMKLAFPYIKIAFFFSDKGFANVDGSDLLDVFIPSNPFRSLSEGAIPAVVLFCIR